MYLRETMSGKPRGNAAVVELTLDDGTRLQSKATSQKRPMDRPRRASEGPDPSSGRGGHYEPTAHANQDWVRETDAEFKILSDLTDQINELGIQHPVGELRLYTEREPCDSCKRIIKAFSARFPGIEPYPPKYDFTVDGEPL